MSGQVITNPSVVQTLIEHTRRHVSDDTLVRAGRHVLDWLGSAMLGAQHPSVAGFMRASRQGAGNCSTLGAGQRDWWHALQFNAAVGNVLEMDDLHRGSILHPGPVIVPAAIAVAEQVGASSRALLMAIVRGYETTIRIGRALGPGHYAYFHNTSTAGTFGAATAAADLLGLDAQQTAWALGNTGSRTGGLWQMRHEACETKSLHNVQAAQCGVQSAMLAAQGVRGPLRILEGPQGLFAATAPGADARSVLDHLDAPWAIHEVSFKPWPACRHAHPTIDAALALRHLIGTTTIKHIDIESYQSAIDFCDKPAPTTELEAKFSLQHCAAAVLLEGAPWLQHFALDYLAEPRVTALRALVRVKAAADLTTRFPQHYGARITVHLADGRTLQHEQADALGDPELPMSEIQLVQKARHLLGAAGLTDTNVEALIVAVLSLVDGAPLADVTSRWTT